MLGVFFSALISLAGLYVIISIILLVGSLKISKTLKAKTKYSGVQQPFVSVVIPARDEEDNIPICLESLLSQEYPKDRYEIIVVDDRSTDRTSEIVLRYQEKYNIIKLIKITSNNSGLTGKQNALISGVMNSNGEIILNIDADCVTGPLWISRTVPHFTTDVGLSIGFTAIHSSALRNLFDLLQCFDMLFLMDAAIGALGVGVPVSCMGSNVAYRKSVYLKMKEMKFSLTEDMELFQSVSQSKRWKIRAIYDKDAIVYTKPEKGLQDFLSQRIRWIWGGQSRRTWTIIPLYGIFLFNSLIAIASIISLVTGHGQTHLLGSISLKLAIDTIRFSFISKRLDVYNLLWVVLPYQIFMIFYGPIVGFGSFFVRKIRWKNDLYSRKGAINAYR